MYTLHQHTTTPLHCRYANFVSSIWGNEITGMTPSELKREIGELAPQFAGYVNPRESRHTNLIPLHTPFIHYTHLHYNMNTYVLCTPMYCAHLCTVYTYLHLNTPKHPPYALHTPYIHTPYIHPTSTLHGVGTSSRTARSCSIS